MIQAQPPAQSSAIARQARDHFVAQLEGGLQPLSDAIRARLLELMDGASGNREAQERRDAMLDFEQQRKAWVEATAKAWRKALIPPTATGRVRLDNAEPLADRRRRGGEQDPLLAPRAWPSRKRRPGSSTSCRVRMEHLDGEELAGHDVLRPEAVAQLTVEQWSACGLSRLAWAQVHELIHQQMTERMVAAYQATNRLLVERGVLPDIDLSARVKRARAGTEARIRGSDRGGRPWRAIAAGAAGSIAAPAAAPEVALAAGGPAGPAAAAASGFGSAGGAGGPGGGSGGGGAGAAGIGGGAAGGASGASGGDEPATEAARGGQAGSGPATGFAAVGGGSAGAAGAGGAARGGAAGVAASGASAGGSGP